MKKKKRIEFKFKYLKYANGFMEPVKKGTIEKMKRVVNLVKKATANMKVMKSKNKYICQQTLFDLHLKVYKKQINKYVLRDAIMKLSMAVLCDENGKPLYRKPVLRCTFKPFDKFKTLKIIQLNT